MGVGVDQAGEHHLAGAVNELVIAALRPLRAHIGDVGALHGYEAVLQGGEAVVHRQGGDMGEQC